MKKTYVMPQMIVGKMELEKPIMSSGSGHSGCSCGCSSVPDGSNTGGGCWGCPNCSHDNQGNHNCWESNSKGFYSSYDDDF